MGVISRMADYGRDGETSSPAAAAQSPFASSDMIATAEASRRLAELAATGESLLAALVAGRAIDPSTINDESGS